MDARKEPMKTRGKATIVLGLSAIILWAACGCRYGSSNNPQQDIVGRWEIEKSNGLNIPHSFFWFPMEFIEFRADGTVLGLMNWPPAADEEIRLNKSAVYQLLDGNRIEIIGSCRYEDPCSEIFNFTIAGRKLRLFNAEASMDLRYMGPADQGDIPTIIGPQPSPTTPPSR